MEFLWNSEWAGAVLPIARADTARRLIPLKSGCIGAPAELGSVEGRVAFADHRVAWLQEVALAACHHVLRRMGDPRSAVRWQAPHGPAHARVNRTLVDLFGELVFKQAVQLVRAGRQVVVDPFPVLLNPEREFLFHLSF